MTQCEMHRICWRTLTIVAAILFLVWVAVAPVSAAITRTWNQSDPSSVLSGCMDENYASIICPDFNTTEPWVVERTNTSLTQYQTMVEFKKFYYRVDNVTINTFHYMNFSVSDVPLAGYKTHPWFVINGTEVPYQYMGAFEGSAYDVSAGAYIVNDSAGVDFNATTGDKLCSIAGALPMSGANNALATRDAFRQLALNRGPGWDITSIQGASALQMLYLIKYGNFNIQSFFPGVTNLASGTGNQAVYTGSTAGVGPAGSADLGNADGQVSIAHWSQGTTTYPYSMFGMENGLHGNIWKWVVGADVVDHALKIDGVGAGITLPATNGYGSNLAYSATHDWLFMPSAVAGDSTHYLCDYYYQATGNRAALLGGSWRDGAGAGAFNWYVNDAASRVGQGIGARAAFTPPIVANFTHTNTSAAFTFTDESFTISTLTGLSGSPSSWNWSFGDGSISTEQNPTHAYVAAGTYNVNLTVSDGTNYATVIKNVNSPNLNLLAQFTPVGNISVWNPDGVTFNDTSTGLVTSWFWDFGDGTNSTLQIPPTHYYPTLGIYNITLNVSVANVYSINSTWVESSINGFSPSNSSGFAPLPVKFTNSTIGNVTTKSWEFGDGNTSAIISPTNTYWSAGEYTVNYTVTHNNASNSTYQNITVENLDFVSTSGTSFGYAPVFVSFQDLSTVSDTWNWTFGDGGTSTDKNPIHLYIGEKGNFTVSLTATANGQSVTTTKVGYISIGFASNHEKIRSEFSGDLTGFFMAIGIACLFPIIIGFVLIARYLNNPNQRDAPTFLMDNGILLFVLILVLVIVLVFVGVIGGKIESIGL